MRQRILWLTFWTTMTYWMGGIFGCAAHTAVVYEAMPPQIMLAAPAPAAGLSTTQPALAVATTQPSLVGLDRSHWVRAAVSPVIADDRHYPLYFRDCPIPDRDLPADDAAATPAGGGVGSCPCNCPCAGGWDTPAAQRPAPGATQARRRAVAWGTAGVEDQLIDALSYNRAGGWNRTNSEDATVQPFKFAADVVLLPCKLVVTPPGTVIGTPAW